MTTTTAPKPQPYQRYPKDEDRAAYAAGLRHIADLVESGAAPVPYDEVMLFLCFGGVPAEEQPAAARDLMRALGGGTYTKDVSDSTLALLGMCGGVPVRIYTEREAVCERVPTGTVSVTEEVRIGEDPRPVETVTRDVETFEWICSPLLAAAETSNTVEVTA